MLPVGSVGIGMGGVYRGPQCFQRQAQLQHSYQIIVVEVTAVIIPPPMLPTI